MPWITETQNKLLALKGRKQISSSQPNYQELILVVQANPPYKDDAIIHLFQKQP
jgi:hypothetical protein